MRGYWENEFAAYDERFRVQVISPVQNKIGMLLSPPGLRLIIGQPRSTIDIARLMNEGGVLIANLTKGKIGATASHLLGAFLATTIAQVAEERAAIPFEARRDFTLYADEVQNFATESFAQTLSEARNWRLMCVLAHQHLSQLPRRLAGRHHRQLRQLHCLPHRRAGRRRDGGRAGYRECPDALRYVATSPRGRSSCMAAIPTEAFHLDTQLPDPPAHGRAAAVIAHTRARHTRERASVERMIARQLKQMHED